MKEKAVSKNKAASIYKIAAAAIFAALIAVGAFIKVPMYPVPITMQMLFTFLAVLLLGKWGGTVSVLIYILIGLLGLPVFSFGGGLTSFLKPSFGYILGFAAGNFLSGLFIDKLRIKSVKGYFAALTLNSLIIYIIGVTYLYLIMTLYLQKNVAATTLIVDYFLIFIPGDVLKALAASFIAFRVKPVTDKFQKRNS